MLNPSSAVLEIQILSGASVSGSFSLQGYRRGSIKTPAVLTGTNLSWEVSHDDSVFLPLRAVGGTAVAGINPATDPALLTLPEELFSYPVARLKSDSNEGADRDSTVYLTNEAH